MKKTYTDPEESLEKKKYQHPVPSRQFILDYLKKFGKPMSAQAFFKRLELTSEDEKIGFKRRLNAMVRDGQIIRDRRKRFCLVDKLDLVLGTIEAHPDGFGFLLPDDKTKKDFYLSPKQMRCVLHGDRVLAKLRSDRRGRKEAVVKKVVEKVTRIVGKVQKSGDLFFVKPENPSFTQNVYIPSDDYTKVKPDQIVIVSLTTHPCENRQILGRVKKVLGTHMDPGLEVDIAINNYDIPHVWPTEALSEVKKCKEKMAHSPENWVDLTKLSFVTIDGADAKDFDDAVYCEKRSNGGFTLYVAIAHVGYFVEPKSALDQEAEKRGNSVYFPNKVVPMFPEFLSNDLCSLKENVKRAALICKMDISKDGLLGKFEFFEGWIKSRSRLTYGEVAAFYDGVIKRSVIKTLSKQLTDLKELYQILDKQRHIRGALNFEIAETRIIFGSDRKIKKIVPTKRHAAHKIIEECMLVANVAAAQLLQSNKLLGLYRNHEKPLDSKLTDLTEQLKLRGILIEGDIHHSKDLANVIEQIQSRPDTVVLQTLILQSMQQANYGPECKGHFGLAYPAYTHFTSPIRRYPDLLVHRAICAKIRKQKQSSSFSLESLVALGQHCSTTERRADTATNDVIDWLKCEFMLEHVGEVFEGVVNTVTEYGLFVTLKELYVEGLVHVTSLTDDYYRFDQSCVNLVGERTKTVYKLGDSLKIKVARVSLDDRKIDFALAYEDE